jgi:PPE-repeat protein
MYYAFLPPEVNSTRMFTGPGAGSILAAAGSWDSLSAELSTTAQSYESVISSLTGFEWRGPASEAMAAAAAEYVAWLQTTAEQAKQTATQARAAAAAYEQAYAMTVPPMLVAANRAQLSSLIATNFLGQNTAAIAATEAQYAEYWALDTNAMSGYAVSSGTATQLTQFSSPQGNTNQAGVSAQKAAVTQASAAATGTTSTSQALSAAITPSTIFQQIQSFFQNMLTGGIPSNPIIPEDFTFLDEILFVYSSLSGTYSMESTVSGIIGAANNLGVLPDLGAAAAAPAAIAPALAAAPQLTDVATGLGGGAGLGNVTAALARAGTIGPMSVPANWSAPSTSTVSALQPAGMTTLPGTDEPAASGYPGYPGMPGAVSRGTGVGAPPRYGVRLTVMPRPPAAG